MITRYTERFDSIDCEMFPRKLGSDVMPCESGDSGCEWARIADQAIRKVLTTTSKSVDTNTVSL